MNLHSQALCNIITCVANTFSIILLVTFVHHLSLTVTNKETFVEALKVVDKPSNVKIGICLYTSMCVCVCLYVCMCVYVCVSVYVCHKHLCMCEMKCVYVCAYAYAQLNILHIYHTYHNICMYVCVHICFADKMRSTNIILYSGLIFEGGISHFTN